MEKTTFLKRAPHLLKVGTKSCHHFIRKKMNLEASSKERSLTKCVRQWKRHNHNPLYYRSSEDPKSCWGVTYLTIAMGLFPGMGRSWTILVREAQFNKTIQTSKEWKVEFSCKTGFLPCYLQNEYANALKVDGFPTLFASQKLVSCATLYRMNVQIVLKVDGFPPY